MVERWRGWDEVLAKIHLGIPRSRGFWRQHNAWDFSFFCYLLDARVGECVSQAGHRQSPSAKLFCFIAFSSFSFISSPILQSLQSHTLKKGSDKFESSDKCSLQEKIDKQEYKESHIWLSPSQLLEKEKTILEQWIIEFKRSLDATYPLSFDLSSSLKVIWTSSESCSSSFYRTRVRPLAMFVSDSLTPI